jgi:hypothetical protein
MVAVDRRQGDVRVAVDSADGGAAGVRFFTSTPVATI